MPTNTYTPLANLTLGSAAASVTFSSISQAYRDLILVVDGTVGSAALLGLQFNSDTGSNYSYIRALGYSGGTASSAGTDTFTSYAGVIGTSQSVGTFNIMDYSASDKHKSVLVRSMSGVAETWMGAARWANTSAITSVKVLLNTSSLNAGTTLSLFGVAA